MVKKQSSAFSAALLLASMASQLVSDTPLVAAAWGTNIWIDGSSSMEAVNQSLKQQFEKQFPETQINFERGGTAVGLQAVLDGRTDLAAIARPLTAAEKARGLVAVPVGREKIAIVIGSNNRLTKGLDINQFAKIFRGEIKNWSQVGGSAGAIRLVDRPDFNDTRQSFRNYPAFQKGKFGSGATAQKLSDDSPRAVVQALGNNGISYLPLSQVRNQPGVKAVLMHGVAPSNARYPFSQPLFYVYKGPTPNPAAAAFLSYATATTGQQAIQQTGAVALKGEPTKTLANGDGKPAASKKVAKGAKAASLNAATQKTETNPTNNQVAQVPATDSRSDDLGLPSWLWWLFPLGSLAALFWMLNKGRNSQKSRPIQAYRDPSPDFPDDPIQTESELAGATWNQGDRNGQASDQSDWLVENPNLPPATEAHAAEGAVLTDDRDLRAPESQKTSTSEPKLPNAGGAAAWSLLSGNRRRSDSPSEDLSQMSTPVSESAEEAISPNYPQEVDLSQRSAPSEEVSGRLVLSPRSAQWAYAYWEIPRSLKADTQRQGGENLMLRLYDVTNLDVNTQLPEHYEQFDCDDFALSCDIPIAASDRTYVAEIGYLGAGNLWLSLARSTPTWVPAHERMG